MQEHILQFWRYKPTPKTKYQGKFCHLPYTHMQIDVDGDVLLCDCDYNMPYAIGNIYKDSFENIWAGDRAQMVRQSVWNGTFDYCSWNCNHLANLNSRPATESALKPWPTTISVNMDLSCNLTCASCREQVIIEKNIDRIQKQNQVFDQIIQWASNNPDTTFKCIPMGRGEIFASHSGLNFLRNLATYPHDNIRLWLTTNGTLITHNQELLNDLGNTVAEWSISLDAATAETYSQVRGADWSTVLAGLELVAKTKPSRLFFNFCIQQKNFHEIEAFADLCQQFGAVAQYQKLNDWGHWDQQWWHDNNVFNRTRASFDQAIDSLQQVRTKMPNRVNLAGELSKYIEKRC